MGRRKNNKSVIEELVKVAAGLPWWVGFSAAIVAYFLFHYFAVQPAPKSTGMDNLGNVMAAQMIKTLAHFSQYLVPGVLCLGAISSIFGRKRRQKLLSSIESNKNTLSDLNWYNFELLVGEAFRQRGYKVVETGKGGADGGVDLVLTKDSNTIFVQCKHWKAGKVPVTIVRELLGAIVAGKAQGGIVVASDGFTREAQEFAQANAIQLIGGAELTSMIRGVEVSQSVRRAQVPIVNSTPSCPACGSDMKKRIAKRGMNVGAEFWGCSRFPKCRGTLAG